MTPKELQKRIQFKNQETIVDCFGIRCSSCPLLKFRSCTQFDNESIRNHFFYGIRKLTSKHLIPFANENNFIIK